MSPAGSGNEGSSHEKSDEKNKPPKKGKGKGKGKSDDKKRAEKNAFYEKVKKEFDFAAHPKDGPTKIKLYPFKSGAMVRGIADRKGNKALKYKKGMAREGEDEGLFYPEHACTGHDLKVCTLGKERFNTHGLEQSSKGNI